MPDYFGVPDGGDRSQLFLGVGTQNSPGTAAFQVWQKPIGISMIHIALLSSGAGGGAGFTGATSTLRGGGSGGGCGGITRFIIPAACVPDVLYVYPGAGGAPGFAGDYCAVSSSGV